MDNTTEMITEVQVRHVPAYNLLRIEGSDVCVPIEIAVVIQHLLAEGYIVGAKAFTLRSDQHAPLTDGPADD